MLTYLHHTDPSIPHYRNVGGNVSLGLISTLTLETQDEWSFLRGASATVDRPLLGWCGIFFLHNVIVFYNEHRSWD